MGTIKDRNGMDLIKAEDIKKRWQEYTEELYKKDLHNPDNHEGMITHTHLDNEKVPQNTDYSHSSQRRCRYLSEANALQSP